MRPKFIESRRQSSEKVDIQNLSWRCDAVFRSLDLVSCGNPLGVNPEGLHDPRVFINSSHHTIRVWLFLKLFCQEQFAARSVCETPTHEFNHTSAIGLHSSLFLLVFFDSQARISLRGEVNRAAHG